MSHRKSWSPGSGSQGRATGRALGLLCCRGVWSAQLLRGDGDWALPRQLMPRASRASAMAFYRVHKKKIRILKSPMSLRRPGWSFRGDQLSKEGHLCLAPGEEPALCSPAEPPVGGVRDRLISYLKPSSKAAKVMAQQTRTLGGLSNMHPLCLEVE